MFCLICMIKTDCWLNSQHLKLHYLFILFGYWSVKQYKNNNVSSQIRSELAALQLSNEQVSKWKWRHMGWWWTTRHVLCTWPVFHVDTTGVSVAVPACKHVMVTPQQEFFGGSRWIFSPFYAGQWCHSQASKASRNTSPHSSSSLHDSVLKA